MLAGVEWLYISGNFAFVDQEKSIDKSYRSCKKDEKLFIEFLQLKKNVISGPGKDCATEVMQYEGALYSFRTADVYKVKDSYSESTRKYINIFTHGKL